jgi:dolichol kinase
MLVAPIATPLSLSYALASFGLADPAAALVGKYTKSQKLYKNKTVNGTFVFFFSTFLVGLIYMQLFDIGSWFILCSLLLAIFLSIIEVFSDPIDDNFTIVVLGTLLMTSLI